MSSWAQPGDSLANRLAESKDPAFARDLLQTRGVLCRKSRQL